MAIASTTNRVTRIARGSQSTSPPISVPMKRTRSVRKPLFPGIVKTKGVCGGSACIVRTRIPVWSVIEWQQMGCSNAKILKIYPTLTASDLVSAENYYQHNKEEIQKEIQENREA